MKLIKFGIVGVLNTAIDFLIFNLCLYLNCPPVAAKALSYSAGTVNSYFLNKKWTFQSQGKFTTFLLLNLTTMLLSMLLLNGLIPLMQQLITGDSGQAENLANAVVILVTLVLNFIGSKWLVFRHK